MAMKYAIICSRILSIKQAFYETSTELCRNRKMRFFAFCRNDFQINMTALSCRSNVEMEECSENQNRPILKIFKGLHISLNFNFLCTKKSKLLFYMPYFQSFFLYQLNLYVAIGSGLSIFYDTPDTLLYIFYSLSLYVFVFTVVLIEVGFTLC